MKAKIFEIKRFAVHDGDGIRTTVFFKGCPLKCVWCHNPESLSAKSEIAYYSHKCIGCGDCVSTCLYGAHEIRNGVHVFDRNKCVACGKCVENCLSSALTLYGKDYSVDEVANILLKDKDFFLNSNGGITLSGGECLLHADFCATLLKKMKENGINTAVDTCGFVSKSALDKVIPFTDVFLYDVKAFDKNTHLKCCGQDNETILNNLLYLDSLGCKTEVRIPYVPEYNDKEIEKIGEFLSKLNNLTKVRLLAYHSYAGTKYKSLDLENTLPQKHPSQEELAVAKTVLEKFSLTVIT